MDYVTDVFKALFSEENASGLWVVIGVCFTLIGISKNNRAENKRRKKDREHELIRTAYFGAVEYINYSFHKILLIGQSGEVTRADNDIKNSEKFYKLFLIASPDVIDSFSKLSLKFAHIIGTLCERTIDLQQSSGSIAIHAQDKKYALEIMNRVNADRKEYNDKKKNAPELLEMFDAEFDKAKRDFEQSSIALEREDNNEHELKMTLLKECVEHILAVNEDMFNAILILRNDLEFKLSKKDAKKVEDSIKSMENQLNKDLIKQIDTINDKILKLKNQDA